VILIFLISCSVFIVPFHDFSSRINISLTALLACVATQFAMSFNLPQMGFGLPVVFLVLILLGVIS
jgi:hypothetical protein